MYSIRAENDDSGDCDHQHMKKDAEAVDSHRCPEKAVPGWPAITKVEASAAKAPTSAIAPNGFWLRSGSSRGSIDHHDHAEDGEDELGQEAQ